MISKMNVLQAIGSLVSLAMYLFLPILGVSVLIPVGFTGETCMQLSFLFAVPLILLVITLIVSLLPIGPYNSIVGIVTALALLIIGFVGKVVAGSQVDLLLQMIGVDKIGAELGGMDLRVGTYAALVLKMNWGLIGPILIMLITGGLGMVLTSFFSARANASNTNAASGRFQSTAMVGGSTRTSRPASSQASHRSHTVRYHR